MANEVILGLPPQIRPQSRAKNRTSAGPANAERQIIGCVARRGGTPDGKAARGLASGQTGLWVVIRQFAGNGDDWTTGDIHLWGACLQQGNDPQAAYVRSWATQTQHLASGVAAGPTVIAAPDSATSPLKIHGPGCNLADNTLLEVTADGELVLASGSGNGYRFAELGPANNPSGWAGVLKAKPPTGSTLG
jgi:hypothetical protein